MDTWQRFEGKKSHQLKNSLFDQSSHSIEKIKCRAYKRFAKRVYVNDAINGSKKIWEFMQLPDAFFIAVGKNITVAKDVVCMRTIGLVDYRMLKKIFEGHALDLLLDEQVNQVILTRRIVELTTKEGGYNNALVLFQDLALGKEVFKHADHLKAFDKIPSSIAFGLNLEIFLQIKNYSDEHGVSIKKAALILKPQPQRCVIS